MRAALLAVFLVSCAAPGRREFRDGVPVERAPVFVTPGYAPAGAGLPEYMPTAQRETVPRGTDRRVLPPTREPGIWASDSEPRAAVHPGTGEPVPDDPVILGVRLPFAPEATSAAGKLPTQLCAFNMSLALEWSRGLPTAERLNSFEKACLAAKLYASCAAGTLAIYQKDVKEKKRLDEVILNRLRLIDRTARAFEAKKCNGLPLLDDDVNTINDLVNRAVSLWTR